MDRGGWSLYLPVAGAPFAARIGDVGVEPVALSEGGFTERDVAAWRERMATWSWMVDRSLVKPQR